MENNLIIQDDLKTHIRSLTGMFTDDGFYVSIDAVLNAIDFAQTVDAEPVRHGEWIKKHGMMPPEYHGRKSCSICGWFALWGRPGHEELSNYCPNCGAKMGKGVQNDQN